MKLINEAKIVFNSKLSNDSFARTAVSAFVAQLDPLLSEMLELKTAVSEAVSNCCVHGYFNKIGKITVNMKLYDNNAVKVTVSDKGVGIPDISKAMEPMFTTSDNEEQAGMGFTVMETFCDSVTVKSKVGYGTRVTLYKKFSVKTEDE